MAYKNPVPELRGDEENESNEDVSNYTPMNNQYSMVITLHRVE